MKKSIVFLFCFSQFTLYAPRAPLIGGLAKSADTLGSPNKGCLMPMGPEEDFRRSTLSFKMAQEALANALPNKSRSNFCKQVAMAWERLVVVWELIVGFHRVIIRRPHRSIDDLVCDNAPRLAFAIDYLQASDSIFYRLSKGMKMSELETIELQTISLAIDSARFAIEAIVGA